MNVGQLVKELSEYPAETIVCLASDEEWNHIKVLYQVDESLTENPDDYEIELVNEEDVEGGEYYSYNRSRYMTVDDYIKVLVLW